MPVELGILGIQDGLLDQLWNAAQRDEDPEFRSQGGEGLVPVRVQEAGLAGLEDLQLVEIREVFLRVGYESEYRDGSRAEQDGEDDRQGEHPAELRSREPEGTHGILYAITLIPG